MIVDILNGIDPVTLNELAETQREDSAVLVRFSVDMGEGEKVEITVGDEDFSEFVMSHEFAYYDENICLRLDGNDDGNDDGKDDGVRIQSPLDFFANSKDPEENIYVPTTAVCKEGRNVLFREIKNKISANYLRFSSLLASSEWFIDFAEKNGAYPSEIERLREMRKVNLLSGEKDGKFSAHSVSKQTFKRFKDVNAFRCLPVLYESDKGLVVFGLLREVDSDIVNLEGIDGDEVGIDVERSLSLMASPRLIFQKKTLEYSVKEFGGKTGVGTGPFCLSNWDEVFEISDTLHRKSYGSDKIMNHNKEDLNAAKKAIPKVKVGVLPDSGSSKLWLIPQDTKDLMAFREQFLNDTGNKNPAPTKAGLSSGTARMEEYLNAYLICKVGSSAGVKSRLIDLFVSVRYDYFYCVSKELAAYSWVVNKAPSTVSLKGIDKTHPEFVFRSLFGHDKVNQDIKAHLEPWTQIFSKVMRREKLSYEDFFWRYLLGWNKNYKGKEEKRNLDQGRAFEVLLYLRRLNEIMNLFDNGSQIDEIDEKMKGMSMKKLFEKEAEAPFYKKVIPVSDSFWEKKDGSKTKIAEKIGRASVVARSCLKPKKYESYIKGVLVGAILADFSFALKKNNINTDILGGMRLSGMSENDILGAVHKGASILRNCGHFINGEMIEAVTMSMDNVRDKYFTSGLFAGFFGIKPEKNSVKPN